MIDLEIMKHWQKWLFEDELRLNYLSNKTNGQLDDTDKHELAQLKTRKAWNEKVAAQQQQEAQREAMDAFFQSDTLKRIVEHLGSLVHPGSAQYQELEIDLEGQTNPTMTQCQEALGVLISKGSRISSIYVGALRLLGVREEAYQRLLAAFKGLGEWKSGADTESAFLRELDRHGLYEEVAQKRQEIKTFVEASKISWESDERQSNKISRQLTSLLSEYESVRGRGGKIGYG